jgi:hypothetical protein
MKKIREVEEREKEIKKIWEEKLKDKNKKEVNKWL